jgi:hypothetical protein
MGSHLIDLDQAQDRKPIATLDPSDPIWRGGTPTAPLQSDASRLFFTASLSAESVKESEPAAPVRFSGFPLGEAKDIEVLMDSATRDRLTPREQTDQIRDWLLFAIVSNAGLTADELNRVLFDLPTVRHGYFRPVTNFEFGETRSCHLGGGEVVAVVPASEQGPLRNDHLAHVADEFRKTLGGPPKTVWVFEYKISADGNNATLTRFDSVRGESLFTTDYGYVSARVSTLEDFTRFMGAVQDLTYVRLDGVALELGGRKLLSRVYRGLRVEDVAAI